MPGSGSSRSISALRLQVPPLRRSASFGGIDIALICLFMAGIYTNCTIQLSAKVPFPSVPAGVAGLLLLWRWARPGVDRELRLLYRRAAALCDFGPVRDRRVLSRPPHQRADPAHLIR